MRLAVATALGLVPLIASPSVSLFRRTGARTVSIASEPAAPISRHGGRPAIYSRVVFRGIQAHNLRAWKQAGGATTYFLYDGAQPVVEMNSSGTVTAVNTFGPTGLLSRTVASTTTFYTFDPQGNVCQRLNNGSAVLSTHAFDAFGSELSAQASSEPWGFGAQAGYYSDRETGLQLLGLRYYDPSQGRFLNRDPSGYQGGINLYNCVHNSPTALTDPTGLGDGDMWYDRQGAASASAVSTALAYYDDHLADPSLGWAGILTDTAVRSGISFVGGLLQLPRMLGHLGAGTECFVDHPSWSTLPGLVQDIAVAGAAIGVGGAASLGAAEEGAAATASEVAPGEAAGEGSECAGGACFAAGTPVRMADGSTKPVERIRPGDLVQARDPGTGRIVVRPVVRTFVRTVGYTVVLTLPGGEQIETTETHPFLVEGDGWVQAGQLGIGTQILTRAGPALGIAGITRRWQAARVYNFEVAGLHCYFVGSSGGGLCVHNTCDPEGSNLSEVRVGDISGGTVTESEALDLAEEWLGPKYTEASPGRFTSETFPGRQFRMKGVDLGAKEPHVHFESIGNNGRDILVNLHLYLK